MPAYQFILAMVLACYVGFSRLHHMRFLQREPVLTGILGVLQLPPQCTFWRFLASLHGSVAGQLLEVQRRRVSHRSSFGAFPGRRRGGGDEVDDDLMTDQRLAAPILANERERRRRSQLKVGSGGWHRFDRIRLPNKTTESKPP